VSAGGTQDSAFVHRAVLSADLHRAGQATVAQIRTVTDSRAAQDQVKDILQDYFEGQGMGIGFAMGQLENKELASALWDVIGGLLQMMAVLMAIVGSIGLSGTLSINVIERSREIGVMRAVGASSFDVARIFIGEGLLLGILSWAQAVPLSMLVAKVFVDALGEILQFPFDYRYSLGGMWLWLGIVVALSFVASWLPANRAAGISVRESLAYE
ncbi:MAG TPA: FtsX-like permease family protein, partial [Anaerolineales bacterium]|nr:FtsX-like permease family protein [Anaerolineales bacterium]